MLHIHRTKIAIGRNLEYAPRWVKGWCSYQTMVPMYSGANVIPLQAGAHATPSSHAESIPHPFITVAEERARRRRVPCIKGVGEGVDMVRHLATLGGDSERSRGPEKLR